MTTEKMARRSFFFDDPLYEDLRHYADQRQSTMSEIVRAAVAEKIQPTKEQHGPAN